MTAMTDENQTTGDDLLVALGNTDIIRTYWRPDGEGPMPDGIVGGDGAGEAVSVRYLNRYLPNARITAYFYVVDQRMRSLDEDHPKPFFVEEQVEFYLTDRNIHDDDAQEVFCDYDYTRDLTIGPRFATEAEAEQYRDRLAAADTADQYDWDGNPR